MPMELAFVGDVMLGRRVDAVARGLDPVHVWGDILGTLRGATLTFANLECAITSRDVESEPDKPFHFRAGPWAADALRAAGFDFVSLANNHALDYGVEGLREAIGHLESAGIAHAGAGDLLDEAARPAVVERDGLRVAVVAAADHPRHWAASETGPGTNIVDVTTSGPSWHRVRAAIREGRREADLVVVSLHWGPNMRPSPSKEFVRYAHALVEEGADVVHGHSAHVLQPIEVHRGRPILYDCGDFVDDYMVDPVLRNDWALLHRIVLDDDRRPARLELQPCLIDAWTCQVNAAEGEAFDAIAQRVVRQAERFGTPLRVAGRRLEMPLSGSDNLPTTRPAVEKR